MVLADEINRTPPKTQAALLEAMQERQVSAGGQRHPLPDPFFVLATQNPIEQEGTYPLPEAQLDRFLFKVFVGYPTPDEERQIYRLHHRRPAANRDQGAGRRRDSRSCKRWCGGCRSRITASTMPWPWSAPRAPASRRPGLHGEMDRLGRRAAGRPGADSGRQGPGRARRPDVGVTIDDIRAVAHPVLRHRLVTTYAAQAEGQTPDTIIAALLRRHSRLGQESHAVDGHVAQVFRS